jgi:hypothetical protein
LRSYDNQAAMKTTLSIEQFSVCKAYNQRLVVLTNTLFNDVDSILVAPVYVQNDQLLISGLQVPVIFNNESCYVDLLDIATVSKKQLKTVTGNDLQHCRNEIKAGIDLLIDGF